ncbi:putative quinone oxidoreductase [Halotydeus destructor]|nr:putative quinone oxidoreductase [Halotydeus destructor]
MFSRATVLKSTIFRTKTEALSIRGYKQLVVKRHSPDFRNAVEIVEVDLRKPGADEVLIKNKFVGVNASDINYCSGRYDATLKPPHQVGFESIGTVEEAGTESKFEKGQHVLFTALRAKAFSEYTYATNKELVPVPEIRPEYLNLMAVGLTAAIGLDEIGRISKGEKVLITAAAGGVGHIAVQWAKLKGCEVIGTCSSEEKSKELKKIGCDHVINYHKEDLKTAIKQFPGGIDVIWDTIGGEATEMFVNALAVKGRLVIVGAISGYKGEGTGFPLVNIPDLPLKLLTKSRVMAGFFWPDYAKSNKKYFMELLQKHSNGEIKFWYDDGTKSADGKFIGMDGIYRAVEHLHNKHNTGKVVVEL